ncbi:response regulator transcription factor [Paenibacillus sp. FSL M7-1046]|uniref:response regulator transcription factor n=1 Tax=Paenibacillus sp. FSL M7-1046 TaxID=2975315 RepID=UPI0030F8A4EE
MDSGRKISVMLVDDHKIMLEGLETLLSIRSEIEIVGTAQTGEEALSGNLLLTGKVAKKLALTIRNKNRGFEKAGKELELTQKELDLARLLIEGYNSKEIAGKLFLTQGTVKNYLSDIYSKIGTNDRAKAVLLLKRYLST